MSMAEKIRSKGLEFPVSQKFTEDWIEETQDTVDCHTKDRSQGTLTPERHVIAWYQSFSAGPRGTKPWSRDEALLVENDQG